MSESRLIRLPELMTRIGIKKTKIYDMIKGGSFPKPVKLGKVSAWPDEKVSEWISNQTA